MTHILFTSKARWMRKALSSMSLLMAVLLSGCHGVSGDATSSVMAGDQARTAAENRPEASAPLPTSYPNDGRPIPVPTVGGSTPAERTGNELPPLQSIVGYREWDRASTPDADGVMWKCPNDVSATMGGFKGFTCKKRVWSVKDEKWVDRYYDCESSFGHVIAEEACIRVGESVTLATRMPRDYSAVCRHTAAPAPEMHAWVKAVYSQYDNIQRAMDTTFLEPTLRMRVDYYLRSVTPLIDNRQMDAVLLATSQSLVKLANNPQVTATLARLGHVSGTTPIQSSGGLLSSIAGLDNLDNFMVRLSPLLVNGSKASPELNALLWAADDELRRLKLPKTADDPRRNSNLLRQLMFKSHPALFNPYQPPMWMALRDHRGLPIVTDPMKAPFKLDSTASYVDSDGQTYLLAQANSDAQFTDAKGAVIPYVSPFATPEQRDSADLKRDLNGVALAADGKPLYRAIDLRGRLLPALLSNASPLFVSNAQFDVNNDLYLRDIPGGLLSAFDVVAGDRGLMGGGDRMTFNGYNTRRSPLLDAVYGAAQVLRAPGIADAVEGVKQFIDNPANEQAIAHNVRVLSTVLSELQKNENQSATLGLSSTFYDDLAPLLARMMTVEVDPTTGKTFLDDVLAALSSPNSKNLLPMLALLANERSAFFINQPVVAGTDSVDPADPAGRTGAFGTPVSRARPDSDGVIDWRRKVTNDPANNRSQLQRMMHLIAMANRQRLCNGRNASMLSGLVKFKDACDMLKVDNVASFFLLSIASPDVRSRTDTFAKYDASFLEAIKNGLMCRGTSSDPQATQKCDELLKLITDGASGDLIIEGIIRIKGFTRYPTPESLVRLLSLDYGDPTKPLDNSDYRLQTRNLLYNHNDDGMVDLTHPDNRSYELGNSKGQYEHRYYIDEHGGVLPALEQVGPYGSLYPALRPLVDAFAKHRVCSAGSETGCTHYENAVVLLGDLMALVGRHYPSPASTVGARTSFVETYGKDKQFFFANDNGKGLSSFEPMLARILSDESLWPAVKESSQSLASIQVNGRSFAQILSEVGRFIFVPQKETLPARLGFTSTALRNDGLPTYVPLPESDAERLSEYLRYKIQGSRSVYYLLKDAFRAMSMRMDWDSGVKKQALRALGDLTNAQNGLLAVETVKDKSGQDVTRFKNQTLLPIASVVTSFVKERLLDNQANLKDDMGKPLPWSDALTTQATDLLASPLTSAGVDMGLSVTRSFDARLASYALIRELLDPRTNYNIGYYSTLLTAADTLQLMANESNFVPLGPAVADLVNPQGPVVPGLALMRDARQLAYERGTTMGLDLHTMPYDLLRNLFTPQCGPDSNFRTPASRMAESMKVINRYWSGDTSDMTALDYAWMLNDTARFIENRDRGLVRLLDIVRGRRIE